MINLMKYEFLKQKHSKLILGGFLLAFELVFLLGMLMGSESMIALAAFALAVTSMVGFVLVAVEAIFTYYRDLTEKQGYMVFMTPNSEYTILGSKLLTNILTILVWTLLILLLAFADLTILSAYYGEVETMLYVIRQFSMGLFGIDVSWTSAVYSMFYMVLEWINTVITAFLAITLAITVLRGRKWGGLISFLLFLGLNYCSNLVIRILQSLLGTAVSDSVSFSIEASSEGVSTAVSGLPDTGITFVVTLVFAIVFFMISGTLLRKKLSL